MKGPPEVLPKLVPPWYCKNNYLDHNDIYIV
jgi:hypothetical protein